MGTLIPVINITGNRRLFQSKNGQFRSAARIVALKVSAGCSGMFAGERTTITGYWIFKVRFQFFKHQRKSPLLQSGLLGVLVSTAI
jgi:hypothetical protein